MKIEENNQLHIEELKLRDELERYRNYTGREKRIKMLHEEFLSAQKKYFDLALNTEGDRFEFEMNFLKHICLHKIDFDIVCKPAEKGVAKNCYRLTWNLSNYNEVTINLPEDLND